MMTINSLSNRKKFCDKNPSFPYCFLHFQGKALYKDIASGLRACIIEHGPITKNFIPSAQKRIWHRLMDRCRNFYNDTGCSRNTWLENNKQRWVELVDSDDNITLPWGQVNKLLNTCIERGEYLQFFEEAMCNNEESTE